jgi:DNA mismatch endonuclease (patch repair protein)
MKRVGQRDTGCELSVRRHLHRAGFRDRLHDQKLPGTPDTVLPRHHTAIFVHGCFWHGHDCKHGAVRAKSKASFWDRKIADNRARDKRKARAVAALGWHVETLWECQSNRSSILARPAGRLRKRRTV